MKNLRQDSQCPRHYLNQVPPKYKSEASLDQRVHYIHRFLLWLITYKWLSLKLKYFLLCFYYKSYNLSAWQEVQREEKAVWSVITRQTRQTSICRTASWTIHGWVVPPSVLLQNEQQGVTAVLPCNMQFIRNSYINWNTCSPTWQ